MERGRGKHPRPSPLPEGEGTAALSPPAAEGTAALTLPLGEGQGEGIPMLPLSSTEPASQLASDLLELDLEEMTPRRAIDWLFAQQERLGGRRCE